MIENISQDTFLFCVIIQCKCLKGDSSINDICSCVKKPSNFDSFTIYELPRCSFYYFFKYLHIKIILCKKDFDNIRN